MSCVIIDARHNGGGVSELVLLKEAVESELQDFLVSGIGDGDLFGASQNLVREGGAVEASLVVAASFPAVVLLYCEVMHFEVVKCNIGDNLLLNDSRVSIVVNTILKSQSLSLLVAVETSRHRCRDLVAEIFDQVDEAEQIRDGAAGSLAEDLPSEDHNLLCSVIINAGHDGGGVGELVLLKHPIESLLDDFLVREALAQRKQRTQQHEHLSHGDYLSIDYTLDF